MRKTNPLPTSHKGEKQEVIIAPFPTVDDAPSLSVAEGGLLLDGVFLFLLRFLDFLTLTIVTLAHGPLL